MVSHEPFLPEPLMTLTRPDSVVASKELLPALGDPLPVRTRQLGDHQSFFFRNPPAIRGCTSQPLGVTDRKQQGSTSKPNRGPLGSRDPPVSRGSSIQRLRGPLASLPGTHHSPVSYSKAYQSVSQGPATQSIS